MNIQSQLAQLSRDIFNRSLGLRRTAGAGSDVLSQMCKVLIRIVIPQRGRLDRRQFCQQLWGKVLPLRLGRLRWHGVSVGSRCWVLGVSCTKEG